MDDLTRALIPLAQRPERIEAVHQAFRPFAHQVRNHLSCLNLSAYLARTQATGVPDGLLNSASDLLHQTELFLDRLQSFLRPLQLVPLLASLSLVLEERREAWAARLAETGRTLLWLPPRGEDDCSFDPVQLGSALDGFVHWRAPRAPLGGAIRLRWRRQAGELRLEWEESASAPRVPEPRDRPPSPLALAALARVAAAHGGRLEVQEEPAFRMAMMLPITARTPASSGIHAWDAAQSASMSGLAGRARSS